MDYTVQEGDCIDSIAAAHGFLPKTLWSYSANAALRDQRKNPNVLAPGDTVVIPEKRTKSETGPCAKRHRFRRLGVPAEFRLRILDSGKPVAGAAFLLDVDGVLTQGVTDGEGNVRAAISPMALMAKLTVRTPKRELTYDIDLGRLDPIDTLRGVQQRLNNLGLRCPEDGVNGSETEEAIKAFQAAHQKPATGQLDSATRAAIKTSHDLG